MKLTSWVNFIKEFYIKFQQDEITALAAQVTYYLILAFFPFLIFFVTLMSYANIATTESLAFLSALLPYNVFTLIFDVVENVMVNRSQAFLSFGMLATLWSASTGALSFMHGINKAYNLKETRPFWKVRLLAIVFIVAFALVILFSFILVIFGEHVTRFLFAGLGLAYSFKRTWDILRYVLILLILLTIFVLFYFYTPNCRIYMKDILPGSILSTVGWLLLSMAFSFYVNNFGNFSKTYGSLGAIIALLIWLYWTSIIVLTGGELNAILVSREKDSICKKQQQT